MTINGDPLGYVLCHPPQEVGVITISGVLMYVESMPSLSELNIIAMGMLELNLSVAEASLQHSCHHHRLDS